MHFLLGYKRLNRMQRRTKREAVRYSRTVLFTAVLCIIKQLLDEAEHDIMNYQNRGLCYLPKPKAEADNSIIVLLYIFETIGKRRHSSVEKWLYFKTKVKVTLISLTKII